MTGAPLLRRRLYLRTIAVYAGLLVLTVIHTVITELWDNPTVIYIWAHGVGWGGSSTQGHCGRSSASHDSSALVRC